jgi:hypothetical protein
MHCSITAVDRSVSVIMNIEFSVGFKIARKGKYMYSKLKYVFSLSSNQTMENRAILCPITSNKKW